MLFDLSGKIALVTGTSGGIGQAMAVGLAEAGASIVAVSASNSNETVEMIRGLGGHARQISADLSDIAGLDALFEEAVGLFGRIDILVNNAGIVRRIPAADYPLQDFLDVVELNLTSLFRLSQLAGRHMIERGSGKIINIASMLSFQGGDQRCRLYRQQAWRRRFDQSVGQRMGRQRGTSECDCAGIH